MIKANGGHDSLWEEHQNAPTHFEQFIEPILLLFYVKKSKKSSRVFVGCSISRFSIS